MGVTKTVTGDHINYERTQLTFDIELQKEILSDWENIKGRPKTPDYWQKKAQYDYYKAVLCDAYDSDPIDILGISIEHSKPKNPEGQQWVVWFTTPENEAVFSDVRRHVGYLAPLRKSGEIWQVFENIARRRRLTASERGARRRLQV